MGVPGQAVSLSVEQVEELNRSLSNMRHDINNTLSLVMAAVELIRQKPHMTPQMLTTLLEQPAKITRAMAGFSAEFERTMGLPRSSAT